MTQAQNQNNGPKNKSIEVTFTCDGFNTFRISKLSPNNTLLNEWKITTYCHLHDNGNIEQIGPNKIKTTLNYTKNGFEKLVFEVNQITWDYKPSGNSPAVIIKYDRKNDSFEKILLTK